MDDNQEMEAAMAVALAADRGESIEPQQDPAAAAAPETASASPESSETPAAQGEAKQQTPEPKQEKPDTTTTPEGQKPESAFTKAQKDKGRRDKTWAELNTEKEKLAADRKQLEADRQQLDAARQQAAQPSRTQPEAPRSKYSAEEYEAAAKDFELKGNYELAEQAKAKAAELRAAPQQPSTGAPGQQPAQQAAPMNQEQFMGAWRSNLEMLTKSEPELGNKDSELGKTTAEMLRTYPLLSTYPTGIRDAVNAAKLTLQARRVPVLEKELTAAKAELERLNKTNSLKGGPPGLPPAPQKKLEDMSLADAEDAARLVALQADREG